MTKTTSEAADERGEEDEEERSRQQQALIARGEYQERLDAVKPGDYQLQARGFGPQGTGTFVQRVFRTPRENINKLSVASLDVDRPMGT